jgi:penicillin-binding protein 1A
MSTQARTHPGARARARGRAAAPAPGRGRRILRIFLAVLKGAVLLTVAAVLLVGFLFWYYGRDLPSVAALHDYRPPQTTRIVDRRGEVIGELFTERRTVVPMKRIPRRVVLAVLAAEDADFYQHHGMDYPGIVRALLLAPLQSGRVQGASTITQQVIKLMLLSPERTLSRKVRELILARRLERDLTKDEILHLYLNHVNFGHGRYGIQEAARFYFGKDVEALTLAEAALLAGIPQLPSRNSPRVSLTAARRRRDFVLGQLEEKRAAYWPDLSLDEIEAARREPIALVPVPDEPRVAEVLVAARQLLRARVGEEAYRQGGFTVHTTIDLAVQRRTRQALRRGLEAVDARHGYRGPLHAPRTPPPPLPRIAELRLGATYPAEVTGADDDEGTLTLDVGGHPAIADLDRASRANPGRLPPSRFAERGARIRVSILRLPEEGEQGPVEARLELGPEGAVVLLDPRSRDVIALVGGYEESAGFNRATQAVRQPGSTFKPIVYALGVHRRRYTPATLVMDAPAVYDEWRPRNFETWRYEGDVRLRDAVARSINVVAVRVIEDLGPGEVVPFARELGITTELDPSLALALGASDVRPIELVNAYATFAAGGRFESPRLVTRIVGPHGRDVPIEPPEPPRDVLTPAESYVVTSLLESVVQSGTGRGARELGRPAAGKTGTSNDARDAWFVGYTPDLVCGVWVGFDDRRPLGRRESGSRTALPIWVDVMRAGHAGRRARGFARPSGVATAMIDPASGLLAHDGQPGAIEEVFVEGTVPLEVARPADVADPDTFLMEQIGGPEETAPELLP